MFQLHLCLVTPTGISLREQRFHSDTPRVMGILNATPDSFHSASRVYGVSAAEQAVRMVAEGASLLDLGGQSTRPGAERVGPDEEWKRVEPALDAIRTALPDVPISIDTFHSAVARKAMDAGADMVNDISAGEMDPELPHLVAELKVPYAIMHMKGTPDTMQDRPKYSDVVLEVHRHLEDRCFRMRELGIEQLMVDPGFGFGKRLDHNFRLLQHLPIFGSLGCSLLVGVSRKSMIHRVLDCTPEMALNGTTAVHAWALDRGAHWLRAHDVAPAMECIRLHQYLRGDTGDRNDD